MKPEDEKGRNLRRDVAKLKAERDIPNKGRAMVDTGSRTMANAYFARDQL